MENRNLNEPLSEGLHSQYAHIDDEGIRELIVATRLSQITIRDNNKEVKRIRKNVVFFFWVFIVLILLSLVNMLVFYRF